MAEVTGTGDLTSPLPTCSGSGAKHVHVTGLGDLIARRVTLAGAGARHYTGTGALIAPSIVINAATSVPDPTIWETDNQPWGQPDFTYADNKPVMIIGNEFYQADRDLRFGEEPLRVILMRSGLTIMGRDRFGNWKADPTTTKELVGLWPIIRGTPGQVIHVYAGAQDTTDEAITWEGPFRYIIGTTTFCDFTVSGRYLAVRFESQDIDPWELLSYDMDLEIIGERG